MTIEKQVLLDEWPGLYSESWKGVIVDEAFAHPAKFSRALIRKIYDHVIAEGWAAKGDSVVDPFGGVALGGFEAMQHGLNWIGVELEIKFHELAAGSDCGGFTKADWRRLHLRFGRLNYTREFHWCPECLAAAGKIGTNRQIPSRDPHRFRGNIGLWNERFSRMPNWGTAKLIQGDSRKLAGVLSGAECCVSSPPYSSGTVHGNHGLSPEGFKEPKRVGRTSQVCGPREMDQYGETPGQLGAMKEGDHSIVISSPPYAAGCRQTGGEDPKPHYIQSGNKDVLREYGTTDGQLGAMPEGQLCVTSPPFESTDTKPTLMGSGRPSRANGDGAGRNKGDYHFSDDEASLGNMRGGFDAAISSPPYEGTPVVDLPRGTKGAASGGIGTQYRLGNRVKGAQRNADGSATGGYGSTDGQIAYTTGETFWSASRLILEQLHQVLTPNAHAVFVVKSFVRNKQIVDFPAQWAQLCEAVGFKLLHDHHALLTEEHGRQDTMTGEGERAQRTVARKSFFRRLAESKGSPRIDYENVLCFRKV